MRDNFTPEPVRTRSRRKRHKDPGGLEAIPKPKQNNEGTGRHKRHEDKSDAPAGDA